MNSPETRNGETASGAPTKKVPNLFIVGAPRCGTTSLHNYIAQHPECYMSRLKEPGYFSRHRVRESIRGANPSVWTYDWYLSLFADAKPNHLIVGESSTSYLRDEAALAEIQSKIHDPRIIAMVRDPVKLISSYYHFLQFSGWETAPTLEAAWRLQDERCAGRVDSASANRPDTLAYRNLAQLGAQTERLLQLFPRDRVLVLISDDLGACPDALGKRVQDFLGVNYDSSLELRKDNSARAPHIKALSDVVKRPPAWLSAARDRVKRTAGVRSLGIRTALDKLNVKKDSHSIDAHLVSELQTYFRPDVELLSEIVGQDLVTRWWSR
ncbi:sulfotransferase family protein [Mycolicibacterium poriferae]|nr:sulfotransferase [Mycolicibacterium poriferae]